MSWSTSRIVTPVSRTSRKRSASQRLSVLSSPGRRLVEQEEARLPGQGAGHRDELALALREHRHLQVAHLDEAELLEDPRERGRVMRLRPVLSHLDVLLDGQIVGDPRQLERPGETEGGPTVR